MKLTIDLWAQLIEQVVNMTGSVTDTGMVWSHTITGRRKRRLLQCSYDGGLVTFNADGN